MSHDFLSCDWGTTSFRLRWVRGEEQKIVREIREPVGIKLLYEEAVRDGARTETERAAVFARFLYPKLEALVTSQESLEAKPPLVISGMASSSVGWRELPYAKAPFSLDGSGLHAEELAWNKPAWLGPTYLISGVATGEDMMRGEESEIIGLMAAPELAGSRRKSLLILPGTHSKHVRIENQRVVDFRTFMTGELFEVLGTQSLLRASVDLQACAKSFSESDRAAFREGVARARDRGLAAGLFRVRTRAVLEAVPLAGNTWFLSGLLIGSELETLRGSANGTAVILAAISPVAELYALALETLAMSAPWSRLPAAQVEGATVRAHALFLENKGRG